MAIERGNNESVLRRLGRRRRPVEAGPAQGDAPYYLHRTRFERIAERKLRRRQFTEDGSVEISGRDLRGGSVVRQPTRPRPGFPSSSAPQPRPIRRSIVANSRE
jgi:hypothetical protein